ncbi:MAG: alpha-amylase family glycosyl hydrolase [Kiritimatiellia bacterium]
MDAVSTIAVRATLLATLCLAAPGTASAQTAEAPMGATVQGQGAARSVVFRVWAPNAAKVGVRGDFNGWKSEPLQNDPAQPGHWRLESRRARPGDAYQFDVDGLARRDPRARAVNQPENKAFIVDPREYRWGAAENWTPPPKEDLVMYEMHLDTFASGIPGNGSPFERATKRLPYLKALGINCIQLMPVNEFTGERSWGYNPGDLFAVESTYGGADGFRHFVRSCHTNGIAVLLDVVHNHYGPSDVAVWQFDQRLPEGSGGIYFYADEERAQTEWGPRPDFSKPDVRSFIVDSIKMFLEEYRVDGFRWDSVHNVRYYLNGERSNADGDRVLAEANDWMRKNRPNALRIAEDHAFDGGGVGFDAQWNSAFQATLSALVRGGDAQRNLDFFAAELERLEGFNWVNFAECHDSAGDLNLHHRLPAYIDPATPDSPRARALALLAGGIALTVPGYPMMLQGFEMHAVEDFSDNQPMSWARAVGPHAGIVRANADLIHLRRNAKGFTPGLKGGELDVVHCDNKAKVIAYSRRQRNAPRDRATMVVVNFSGAPIRKYGVRFPASGPWFCHYNSGSSAYAKDFDNVGPKPGQGFELPPGQTTLPLDMSRYSLLVFSQSRPPNATLAKAAFAPEIKTAEESAPAAGRAIEDFVEEVIAPFPYVTVPLPAEWKP